MFTLKYFQFQLKSSTLAFLVFPVNDAWFKNPCSTHRKFIGVKLTSQRAIPSSPLHEKSQLAFSSLIHLRSSVLFLGGWGVYSHEGVVPQNIARTTVAPRKAGEAGTLITCAGSKWEAIAAPPNRILIKVLVSTEIAFYWIFDWRDYCWNASADTKRGLIVQSQWTFLLTYLYFTFK